MCEVEGMRAYSHVFVLFSCCFLIFFPSCRYVAIYGFGSGRERRTTCLCPLLSYFLVFFLDGCVYVCVQFLCVIWACTCIAAHTHAYTHTHKYRHTHNVTCIAAPVHTCTHAPRMRTSSIHGAEEKGKDDVGERRNKENVAM